jgi:hypothetical protein
MTTRAGLAEFDIGEQLEVSERATPMTVTDKKDAPTGGGIIIRAENRHGRYRLRSHGDGSISFRAGGELIAGDVNVTPVEDS